MDQQTITQFTTKEDQEKFDKWTKEEIYEAYLAEVAARKQLNSICNQQQRILARIRQLAT